MHHEPTPPLFRVPEQGPHNHTPPSRERSVARRDRQARARYRLLEAIQRSGRAGATNQELADRLHMRESSVCSGTNELKRLGFIELRPEHRRSNYADGWDSDRRHQVWIVKRV